MRQRLSLFLAGSAMLGSLLVAMPAFAQTQTAQPQGQGGGYARSGSGRAPGVFGSVTAISGDTLTVQSKGFGQNAAQTTYSVDASNATVTKNGSSSSLGSVAVGDMVMVQGTVSGTSVTATAVRDGMPQGMQMNGRGPGSHASSTPSAMPQGNGEPVVGGSITAISGSAITITNKSNVTYTIDASSATVTKGNASSTLAQLAIGDNIIVQGAVNGSSVTASSVIDQGAPKGASGGAPAHGVMGVLGGIGSFFHHLFGFF